MPTAPPTLRLCPPEAADSSLPRCDPRDLAAVFRRYGRYVAAVAHKLLGRDDEIDDVVQEVFLAALSGLAQLRSDEPGAVKGWLATVTVRVVARKLRRRRLRDYFRREPTDGHDRYDEVAAPGATPDERLLLARVYALLDEIPIAQRLAWTLRHIEGEPLERVARLCDCSLATAKRRIAAAHETIEKVIGDE